jgi:hypothetical protein
MMRRLIFRKGEGCRNIGHQNRGKRRPLWGGGWLDLNSLVKLPVRPDLTAGGKPDDTAAVPLGPTGMRGWIYHQHLDTSMARQILVTGVEEGSPAHGRIGPKDAILGVSGRGVNPVAFDSDARIGRCDSGGHQASEPNLDPQGGGQ